VAAAGALRPEKGPTEYGPAQTAKMGLRALLPCVSRAYGRWMAGVPRPRAHADAMERGQTTAEYVGLLVIVAAVLAVIATSDVGAVLATKLEQAICSIGGGQCGGASDPSGAEEAGLRRRENALASFASRGGQFTALLDQARAARQAGDLQGADRLLDTLDHYRFLIGGGRGELVADLASPTEAAFDELMGQETIDLGATNRRYFRVEPAPGDGLVVMDYFIEDESSGGILKGDGRGLEDPVLGDLDATDSRITLLVDRESGRGLITQSETCTVSGPFGIRRCQAPRPVDLGPVDSSPQVLPGDANEFDLATSDEEISLDYDALNSLTPGALSVDGGITLERGEDGFYAKTRDTRDDYPNRAIYQYRPGRLPRQVDYDTGEPVFPGASPKCDLPDLPDLPGRLPNLPDLPTVPGPC
jgi:hypothetical protein